MISVSEKCYKDIETSLERYWNSTCWPRIVKDGKRGTYEEVTSRFDIFVEELDNHSVCVKLVHNENPEVIPYDEVFDKLDGKLEV